MKEDLKFDITIEQGSDFPLDLIYADDNETPVNVSGWIVESVIRESERDYYSVPFICSADNKGFHLSMSAARTNQLTFSNGVYDVFITDPQRQYRTRLISGKVTVIPNPARIVR